MDGGWLRIRNRTGSGYGICFLPDEGGGSTEGVDGAGMVADPEPDWTGWLGTDGGGGGRRTWRVDPD